MKNFITRDFSLNPIDGGDSLAWSRIHGCGPCDLRDLSKDPGIRISVAAPSF
jgi:hypothetical protein